MRVLVFCVGFLFLAAVPALAQDTVLRSDLPILATRNQPAWPQSCGEKSKNEISMCSSFALGDWKEQPTNCFGSALDKCAFWVRLEIFSVLDGGYVYSEANDRAGLPWTGDIAEIIELVPSSGLYAIRVGARGGSKYILLSAHGAPIKEASILDAQCPEHSKEAERRDGASLIVRTDYCNVHNMDGLIKIGLEALNRAPFATLRYIEQAPAN